MLDKKLLNIKLYFNRLYDLQKKKKVTQHHNLTHFSGNLKTSPDAHAVFRAYLEKLPC